MTSNWHVVIPTATENLITNPSFEKGTTGWATAGSTLTSIDTDSVKGQKCLEVSYGGASNTLAYYDTGFLPTSFGTYAFSCWVKVPTNWDGGNVNLDITAYSGADIVTPSAIITSADRDKWVYLYMIFTLDVDTSGWVLVEASGFATAGRKVLIDGVQLEELDQPSTYCDGDQDGCSWTGDKHASTSIRPETYREGGKIVDLSSLSFYVTESIGVGVPDTQILSEPLLNQDGSAFQRALYMPRTFTLKGELICSSLSDYHQKKAALIAALALDPNQGALGTVIRYTGADIAKNIRARYLKGLGVSGKNGFTEEMAISFLANNPMWKSDADTSATLGIQSVTVRGAIGKVSGAWSDLGPPGAGGTYTDTLDMAIFNPGYQIVVGNFLNWDGIASADYIVSHFNGVWTSITTTTPANGIIYRVKISPLNQMTVGGAFTTIDGVTTRGIAKRVGTTWTAIGPPSSGGTVYDMEWISSNRFVVAGNFLNWDGVATADYIAVWTGSAWTYLHATAAPNNIVYALAWSPMGGSGEGGRLYIGGAFTTIGITTIRRIGYWDENSGNFTELGGGMTGGGEVKRILLAPDGRLYAAGTFTSAGGISGYNYLAYYHGGNWFLLQGAPNAAVTDIHFDGDGNLWASGSFTQIGDTGGLEGLAYWDGYGWHRPEVSLPSGVPASVVRSIGDDIYVGLKGTGTATFSQPATITNEGTAKAFPVIEITRDGGTTLTIYTIWNETTNRYLYLNYSLQDGETLTLDLRPGSRSARTTATTGSGEVEPIWPFLPGSNTGDFFLAPGDNVINISVDVAGSPTIAANIQYRGTYLSND